MEIAQKDQLVSVIIPSFNHAAYVGKAIASVIEQDYDAIELIIIDDGSSDESKSVIEKYIPYCNERFKRFEFRYRENRGLCATLNEAIAWCQGEYISLLASDDSILKEKLKIQTAMLNEADEKCAGIFGSINLIGYENEVFGASKGKNRSYLFDDILFHRHNLPACTQLLKLKYVREMGELPEDIIIEDWYMWLKLTENKRYLLSVKTVFSNYRVHFSNISSNLEKMHVGRLQVLKKIEKTTSNKKMKHAIACSYLASSLESNKIAVKLQYIMLSLAKSIRVIFEKKLYLALRSSVICLCS